jgi:hypothetical protein
VRSLGLLAGGSLAIWLLLAYPAWLLGGTPAVVFSAVAWLLCLIPTVATLLWCLRAERAAPEQRLLAALGGTGIRLVVVLGGGMALFHAFPYFHHRTFWIWVIVFYLLTLALEVGLLLLTRRSTMNRSQNV